MSIGTTIRKIKVSNGIFWVEIPEADLRVLCGCPSDTVKHLMRRGLILPTEENGATFETGPNAILLSDVLLQNGQFSNMAEFPVLQMLYRQGMMLPDHPNNTGAKPLLMGLKEQVKAQMAYIYRGNYGLISEEEMREAGASPQQAREWMRLKIKFAFGKIRPTREIIDALVVEHEPVEIKNEVTLRRLEVNLFEFTYRDKSVTVDLNLGPSEEYASPYPLGFHDIKRAYFSIIHSGQGDGWDVNRPSMSSILMFQGKIYLIDAGPHIMNTLIALGIGINEIEGIFHTHSHDDHFAGLPSLIRGDRKIKYFATPLVRASVTKKLTALLSIDEESVSYYFDIHDLKLNVWNDIEGLEVRPIHSPHPVETTVFLFRSPWEDRVKTYAHFADIAAFDVLDGMVTDDPDAPGLSRKRCEGVKKDYLTPTDVKKLDIGGGMIHGKAEDFRHDRSTKILLAHTALPLTDRQKEIGAGAPFGTTEQLIPAFQDYGRRMAHEFLSAYFPEAPPHQIRILLNNQVEAFTPESIILKEGVINQEMFLVLTGNVEVIQSGDKNGGGGGGLLYAGTLVGEVSGLFRTPSRQTFRAASFVQALRIPSNLYIKYVNLNRLYRETERLLEIRELFQQSWLFGEGLSYAVQTGLAQGARRHSVSLKNGYFKVKYGRLFLIKKGRMERFLGNQVHETLRQGDFFGEESAIFGAPALFGVRPMEDSELYEIPGEMLADIPIVRWKLFETYERRRRLILTHGRDEQPVFEWRDEFGVDVMQMDEHHQTMFEMGAHLVRAMKDSGSGENLDEAMTFLVKYARYHFQEEEEILKKFGYPDYKKHKKAHKRLLDELLDLRHRLESGNLPPERELIDFFQEWVTDHILDMDLKYARFFKDKGTFFTI